MRTFFWDSIIMKICIYFTFITFALALNIFHCTQVHLPNPLLMQSLNLSQVLWCFFNNSSFSIKRHTLTLFRMGFSGATYGYGEQKAPLPKICHTYPTIMKLGTVIPYLKKFQKLYESRDTPLEFCWHQHFFTRNQQILLYQEIQI